MNKEEWIKNQIEELNKKSPNNFKWKKESTMDMVKSLEPFLSKLYDIYSENKMTIPNNIMVLINEKVTQ